jgi:hypothetical protein
VSQTYRETYCTVHSSEPPRNSDVKVRNTGKWPGDSRKHGTIGDLTRSAPCAIITRVPSICSASTCRSETCHRNGPRFEATGFKSDALFSMGVLVVRSLPVPVRWITGYETITNAHMKIRESSQHHGHESLIANSANVAFPVTIFLFNDKPAPVARLSDQCRPPALTDLPVRSPPGREKSDPPPPPPPLPRVPGARAHRRTPMHALASMSTPLTT